MVRHKVDWHIYLIVAIITSVVFFSGIYIGIILSREKISVLAVDVKQFGESLQETELTMLFLSTIGGNQSCELLQSQMNKLAAQSDETARKVIFYETEERLRLEDYPALKKQYMLTVLKHWLYFERMKKDCVTNATTVLYFYSNVNCPSCGDQGTTLSYLKQKYDDALMVFPVDYDTDLSMIKMLGQTYGFSNLTVPVMVIDGKKYEGFIAKTELQQILCLTNNAFC